MSSFALSSAADLPVATINQVLGRIIAWILVPVCTFLLSDIFWKIYYPDEAFTKQSGSLNQLASAIGQRDRVTTSWDWFLLREPIEQEPVQPARIEATLIGIVGFAENGTAMIALKGKNPKIYRIGDEVQEGIFLSRLGNDHVILLRGEAEEKLTIKKADNLFVGSTEKTPDAKSEESYPRRSSDPIVSEIRENPLKIGKMIKFEAVDTGRYGKGIKVEPVTTAEHDLLARLNLNPDDIVVGIAKKRVADIMADPASFKNILNEREIRIQFMRDGKLKSTVVKMD